MTLYLLYVNLHLLGTCMKYVEYCDRVTLGGISA